VPTCNCAGVPRCAVTLLGVAQRSARRNSGTPARQHSRTSAPRHSPAVQPSFAPASARPSGATGWDDYADFYDWENAQTMARRDVPFWARLAAAAGGPVLELGCGTGRIALPVGRGGTPMVGIDLSARMLMRARTRVRRARLGSRVRLVRGDIRQLPFPDGHFALVMAPYGILQSLVGDADLSATLAAVAAALRPGGRLVLELVADLPAWHEYSNATRLRGWRPGGRSHVTLIESVRQDKKKGLTLFEQEFVERRGRARASRRFTLAFRTLSVAQMAGRLQRAGLRVTARLGSYDGDPWTKASETWILIAER
jgi:SAM-dependent methyltransferase